ncbi:MAG: RNA methyltransferase [Hyphomicrobiales bacterium]|nr:MAG: RNA methyltransferase [Hyphomicrobiales bacterium]
MSRPDPTPKAITSLQNERVKLIRSLEMRKVRRETGLFIAEGASVLMMARDAGWSPKMLAFLAGSAAGGVTKDLVRWAMKADAECLEVSEAVLGKIAAKDNPQSVIGVFEQRWQNPPAATDRAETLWVALEAIRDPGNLGTIIRTTDAVGASGVLLVGQTVDPYSREAVRASMGSVFSVPLARLEPPAFLDLARRWKGAVVGTHLDARTDFRKQTFTQPTLLVMGSEGPGLSDTLKGACTDLVKIPMAGKLDSLNLAVATALILYEARRTRLTL